MTTNVFLEWLGQTPTQITVVVPLVVFSIGFLFLSPSKATATAKLLALSISLTPVSWLFSCWGDTGLSVFPAILVALAWLVLTKKLSVKQNVFGILFACYLGGLLPDALGSWTAFQANTYFARSWHWGIGGWGIKDGLVVLPPVFLAVLFAIDLVLRKKKTAMVAESTYAYKT